jgi:hypothetical protein
MEDLPAANCNISATPTWCLFAKLPSIHTVGPIPSFSTLDSSPARKMEPLQLPSGKQSWKAARMAARASALQVLLDRKTVVSSAEMVVQTWGQDWEDFAEAWKESWADTVSAEKKIE